MSHLRYLIIFLLLILNACKSDDSCSVFIEVQEATFLLLNIVDKDTGEDLIFGNNAIIPFDSLIIKAIDDQGEQKDIIVQKIVEEKDSLSLVILRDNLISTLYDKILIDYNGIFPSDTLYIDYVEGIECGGRFLRTDYNIRNRAEYICTLCFSETINLLK